jgi:hypothetical protein
MMRAALPSSFGSQEARHLLKNVGVLFMSLAQPMHIENQEKVKVNLLYGGPLLGHDMFTLFSFLKFHKKKD